MTPTNNASRHDVDFDQLVDVEAGDVIEIHFTEDSIGDVAYLLGMIRSGILTSPDETVLLAIQLSGDWGGGRNRYVEFRPTATFDLTWFEGRMRERIDKLEVKSRQRPLVDVSVLAQPNASVRYRFGSNGVNGVADMLDLHDMGVLELGAADNLRAALAAGQWSDSDPNRGRVGHFSNRLDGDYNGAYREHFIAYIVPHLEFLRS